jgi:hypothetical protein
MNIASFLDNDTWIALAFAWKYFLVGLATMLDPNNPVRKRLELACPKRALFVSLLRYRVCGPMTYADNARRKKRLDAVALERGDVDKDGKPRMPADIINYNDMEWVLEAPTEFFLAHNEFTALDQYRSKWMTNVVRAYIGNGSDLLLKLLESVEPLVRGRLRTGKHTFEFLLETEQEFCRSFAKHFFGLTCHPKRCRDLAITMSALAALPWDPVRIPTRSG